MEKIEQLFRELTVAESKKDWMKREALTRYGAVFGGEDIEKLGTGSARIVSKPVVEDGGGEEELERCESWVRERIKEKASKDYPGPMFLLVTVNADVLWTAETWGSLVAACRRHVDRDAFERTYLINVGSKLVSCL